MPVPSPDHQTTERRSLRQIAVEKITAAILDGTLQPGEDLHDDQLQAWLGMSRTPVREALTELTRLGLVETEPQRHTRVASVNPTTAIYDLQTIGALLGGLTRITIPTLDDTATADVLSAVNRALDALHAGDHDHFLPYAIDVADRLRAHCPNPVLLAATSDMIDAKIHSITLAGIVENADWDRLTHNYETLRDAVAAGDAIAAELAVEALFLIDAPLSKL